MAKRKVEDSDEEVDASDDVSDEPKAKKPKKTKVVKEKKEKVEKPKKEKAAPKAKAKAKAKEAAPAEQYVTLGTTKRITVRKFKDATLIDIREFYKDKESGELKPGKKGISLSPEQWATLKESFDEVDKFVAELEA